ncbi:MAG: UvrB/UvrC motif-containing protein, partial [Patescibacteria group bacterium]
IKSLEKEMKLFAKEQKFEGAEKVKRQIFALTHIQDIALIKRDLTAYGSRQMMPRIEAYDVAHMYGTNVVAVMAVVEDGELAKSQYRKFKIRLDSNDDTFNLKEVLTRRLAHPEWRFPNLIVVDGGKGQLNTTKEVLKKAGLNIDVVSVVKDERHKVREILGIKGQTLSINSQDLTLERSILLANSEAHRFAIDFHRRLRGKRFRI